MVGFRLIKNQLLRYLGHLMIMDIGHYFLTFYPLKIKQKN